MKLFLYTASLAVSIGFTLYLITTCGWGIWLLSVASAITSHVLCKAAEAS